MSVGTLCVTGVMMPITPNGANSSQAKPVAAAVGGGLQKFDAGHQFENLQLLDLVIEPADLGFVQLHLAPGLGVLLGDRFDELDDRVAVIERKLDQLFLRLGGGGDGLIDVAEDAVLADGNAGRRCAGR